MVLWCPIAILHFWTILDTNNLMEYKIRKVYGMHSNAKILHINYQSIAKKLKACDPAKFLYMFICSCLDITYHGRTDSTIVKY